MAKNKELGDTSVKLLREIIPLVDTPRSSFGDVITESLKVQSGWSFTYNLNPVFVNTIEENGGTVEHETSFAKLQSGVSPNAHAEINTKRALSYTPGVGAVAKFTCIFGEPKENSKQLIGIGSTTDGWFFGYNGLKFGILRVNNSQEFWVYQDQWSEDARDSLNPQKGNVYQIDFQWLGFGAQYFSIEDSEGNLSQVHIMQYANKNIDVSVRNPSLPITAKIVNNGNTENITLKTPSAVAGSFGDIDSSAFEFPIGFDQIEKSISPGEEVYLFSIQNPETYLGKANRLYIFPTYLSFASDGNKSVIIRVYFNPTLTDPSFEDIATGITPAKSDVLATGIVGGLKVITLVLSKEDSKILDITALRGLISPDGIISVTAESAGASLITSGITLKSRI